MVFRRTAYRYYERRWHTRCLQRTCLVTWASFSMAHLCFALEATDGEYRASYEAGRPSFKSCSNGRTQL